jgi:hypothetical protein
MGSSTLCAHYGIRINLVKFQDYYGVVITLVRYALSMLK